MSTQLNRFFTPRLVELGKIKIGKKEDKERESAGGNKWRAPMKLDHFLITTMNRDARGDLILDQKLMDELVGKGFGDADKQLRHIPVYVASDDIDDIMQTAWVWYAGRGPGAREKNGEVTWFVDPKTGQRLPQPIVEPWKEEYAALMTTPRSGKPVPLFKKHTVLNVMVGADETTIGGVHKFRTTGETSGSELYGSLLDIQEKTRGLLAWLPLLLVVSPKVGAPDGKATTYYAIHFEMRTKKYLELMGEILQMAKFREQNAQAIESSKASYKMLVANIGNEPAREVVDIVEEFHPDLIDSKPVPPPVDHAWDAILAGESTVVAPPVDEPAKASEPAPVAPPPGIDPAEVKSRELSDDFTQKIAMADSLSDLNDIGRKLAAENRIFDVDRNELRAVWTQKRATFAGK